MPASPMVRVRVRVRVRARARARVRVRVSVTARARARVRVSVRARVRVRTAPHDSVHCRAGRCRVGSRCGPLRVEADQRRHPAAIGRELVGLMRRRPGCAGGRGEAARGGAPALRARLSVGRFARSDGVGSLGRDGHGARDRARALGRTASVAVRARRAWRWRERHHPHGSPASALSTAGVQPTEHVACCSAVRAVLPEPASGALGRTAGRRQRGQPSRHWPRRRLVLQPWRRRPRRWRWRQRRRGAARGKVPLGGAVAEITMHYQPLRGGVVGTPRHGRRRWKRSMGESARQLWRRSPWDPARSGSPQGRSSAIAGCSRRTDVPPPAAQPRGRACSGG